jgi:hypothetical protein
VPNGYVAAGVVLGLALGWTTAGRGSKTTDLRLWDVVALGPWLASLAFRRRSLARGERFALAVAAGATIAHNGRNMLAARERQQICDRTSTGLSQGKAGASSRDRFRNAGRLIRPRSS